jgi:hypothetical protein
MQVQFSVPGKFSVLGSHGTISENWGTTPLLPALLPKIVKADLLLQ